LLRGRKAASALFLKLGDPVPRRRSKYPDGYKWGHYENVEKSMDRLFADISELKRQIRERDERIDELEAMARKMLGQSDL
jgi:hypothetical protein